MSAKTISTIRDPLAEEIKTAITGLVDANIDGIANEVANAEDGKLSVAFSVKLTLEGLRVAGVGSLSYSRKFKDEAEFITPDPSQPTLPGVAESVGKLRRLVKDGKITITTNGGGEA